jgi:hypothetical protein
MVENNHNVHLPLTCEYDKLKSNWIYKCQKHLPLTILLAILILNHVNQSWCLFISFEEMYLPFHLMGICMGNLSLGSLYALSLLALIFSLSHSNFNTLSPHTLTIGANNIWIHIWANKFFHNWDLFLKSHPLRALKRFSKKLYIWKPQIGSHLGQCHKGPLGYTRYMVEVFWNFANMTRSFMALGKATTPCSLLVLINIINYCKDLLIVFENTFPHGRCFHHSKGPYAIHMQTFQDSKNVSYITLKKFAPASFP